MSPRTLAPLAALVGLVFGGLGLLAAGPLASLFGLTLDTAGLVVARLACASYLGYGVLSAMARGVEDPTAWRAIAAANAVGWGAGGVVMILAILGLLGGIETSVSDARVWVIPAMQVAFTGLWAMAFVGARRPAGSVVRSAA